MYITSYHPFILAPRIFGRTSVLDRQDVNFALRFVHVSDVLGERLCLTCENRRHARERGLISA